MSEQWMVRVEDHEYGPVDDDTLREWKNEGRLIPKNEVRRVADTHCFPAGELAEIFSDEPPPQPSEPPDLIVRRRTWPEIFRETIRIYRGGFWRFLFFGLLTAVPMFLLQWYFPKVALPDFSSGSLQAIPAVTVPRICFIMFLFTVLLWPISTAGFQYVADDVLRRRSRSFTEQISAAFGAWVRMLSAGLLVYGSYFFWTIIPFSAMLAALAAGISFLSIL